MIGRPKVSGGIDMKQIITPELEECRVAGAPVDWNGAFIRKGLKIVHGVGVFDSDYFGEALIPLHNITNETLVVGHGERIAQAELVELPKYDLIETDVEPAQTTDRVGGFGSTGT